MSNPPMRDPTRRPSGGERVFADDDGRLWSAAPVSGEAGAIVFTCISDSRQSARAMAPETSVLLADVADETLREWLRQAPRMGRLT